MRKLLFLIFLTILPLAAMADNVGMTKTLTYHFTGVSDDRLVSNNPRGGDEKALWTAVSSYHYWSDRASAVGAHCNYNDYLYTRSLETFPEVIQKVTVNAGAWSDVSTSLRLNNREVSLKTIRSSAYAGNESRIQFADYVFENVSTSDKKGHLFLEYILSGQADIFIRSITVEYVEGAECDMSEIPTSNAFYAATSFLCERGVLDGSRDDGKYSVEERLLRKHLANITFRGLFTLNGREIPSTFVSDQYPAIYKDLKSDAPYYQAAKTLLYLDYGDGITPFDRDRDGFFPDGYESRINILKELMEAFNIKPDTEGKDNPFPNDPGIAQLSETSPIRMGYVRRAAKLGIITTENTEFHPFVDCLRGEAFLMLARIIQKIEAGEIADPNPQKSDFLDPNSGTGTVEPYAVLSNNNTVLTFYYDNKKAARGGMDIINSYVNSSPYASATTAVIDASFADYRPTSTAYWFTRCSSLTSITGMENLKTDNVTDMYGMFDHCESLTSLDLSGFNTQNVTCMYAMFFYCSGLTSLDLSGFNTQNVTTMHYMFYECSGLTSLNVKGFKTDKVTSMYGMFSGCSSLTSLNLSGFNTQNVTNMGNMFAYCDCLANLDVTGFNTQNVTNMFGMFWGCTSLTSLDLSGFNTKNVTDMAFMFNRCTSLTTIYAGDGWSTAAVTNGGVMFTRSTNLKGGAGTTYDANHTDYTYAHIDGGTANPGYFTNKNATPAGNAEPYAALSDDNTVLTFYYDNQKEQRKGMGIGPFTSGFDRGWDNYRFIITTVVFDPSFANYTSLNNTAYWFDYCTYLTSIKGLQYLKTDHVTDMNNMFVGCRGLESIDLSGFITDNVIDMSSMFAGCSSLKSLDVSSFNTSNVINMRGVFAECYGLTSLDVTGFNTSNVTDMSWLFSGLTGLTSIDVSGFNTSNVTNMNNMFRYCHNMPEIDISNFKTDNVTIMDQMFEECYGLKTIYVGNGWSTAAVTSGNGMFGYCINLVGGAGTTYYGCDAKDHTVAHIDGGADNPGYFTDKNATPTQSADPEPYAVLTDNDDEITTDGGTVKGKTLTFYYDNQKEDRSGMSVVFSSSAEIGWGFECERITRAVFDGSFANCTTLTSTKWWFLFCKNLKTITGITNLKTDNVTDMTGMFYGCRSLTSLDLSSLNTSSLKSMFGIFQDCFGLKSINLTNFITDKVEEMGQLFLNCSSLESLDLSGFKTDRVSSMFNMFRGCSNLTTVFVGSNWSTEAVSQSMGMFQNCTSLVGGAGTAYDANHIGHTYAHIDGGTSNPGYFTAKADADLDGDGKVDDADVTMLVSVVMGGDKNKLADADLNHDGKVDIADVVMLVNIIKSQKK